jgi:hypothetical protein
VCGANREGGRWRRELEALVGVSWCACCRARARRCAALTGKGGRWRCELEALVGYHLDLDRLRGLFFAAGESLHPGFAERPGTAATNNKALWLE